MDRACWSGRGRDIVKCKRQRSLNSHILEHAGDCATCYSRACYMQELGVYIEKVVRESCDAVICST